MQDGQFVKLNKIPNHFFSFEERFLWSVYSEESAIVTWLRLLNLELLPSSQNQLRILLHSGSVYLWFSFFSLLVRSSLMETKHWSIYSRMWEIGRGWRNLPWIRTEDPEGRTIIGISAPWINNTSQQLQWDWNFTPNLCRLWAPQFTLGAIKWKRIQSWLKSRCDLNGRWLL